jgi:TolB-like protein/tRNA A-37 threonylcarbamoyl transferase component Bud32
MNQDRPLPGQPDQADSAAGELPARIGGYRIIGRLGTGGMGEVFLGEDEMLGRRVAIKRVLPSMLRDPHASRRLLIEARAAAQLDHPHICAIFEVGDDDGLPFIVMPVAEGETLETRLERGPMPLAEAVGIAVQLADALAAAHARGVLHRDIKPGNIIVNASGEIRVMDFGLAKLTPVAASDISITATALTESGSAMGTGAYMSPEQARGETVDARSDLFSAGVVIYEMVAGRRPFGGKSFAESVAATLHAEPSSLVRQRPEIPDELQRIVSKALRKERDERYQSATDLLVDLRALQGASQPGGRTLVRPRAPHRAIAAAALALVAIAALGAWWGFSRHGGFRAPADSLLVLPLVNDTGDPQKEYVADEMTDSVIRDLSALPTLKVMGRQTAFRFKGRNVTPQEIGKTLPVRAVMSGRLRRAGDELAVDVELSDTTDGTVIISRQYLEPATSGGRIEVEITSDLVRDLRVSMTAPAARRLATVTTANGQAYQLHLRARFHQNLETPDGFHQAIALNRQAIVLDPGYAVAWVDIAQSAFQLGTYFEDARDWMPQAKIAALEALRIDPTATDPHVVLGLVALVYDWDMPTAERELAGMGPATASVFSCSVHLLQSMRKSGAAEGEIARAIAADPLSATVHSEVGCNGYYARRYEAAIEGDKTALEIDPRNIVALWGLARAYGQIGRYAEAINTLDSVTDPPPIVVAERGYVLARQGKAGAARAVLDSLAGMQGRVYVDPYLVAEVYAGLGDGSHAVESLEAAYRARSGLLTSLSTDPKWDPYRELPGFKDLQKRIGI